jgi:hypothetical protein
VRFRFANFLQRGVGLTRVLVLLHHSRISHFRWCLKCAWRFHCFSCLLGFLSTVWHVSLCIVEFVYVSPHPLCPKQLELSAMFRLQPTLPHADAREESKKIPQSRVMKEKLILPKFKGNSVL